MFLPTIKEEIKKFGWNNLDIIIITGDTYIDSPFIGAAVIGNHLFKAGFKVGIIAQPDIGSGADIERLGEPGLFWAVTAGSLDSMLANYTALKKKRKSDDLTPGGKNTKRPDRACIAYSNLIRRYFKNTKPIVLGGVEASLRRIAHYDFWDDKIRKSILFDSKADLLIYGMAEEASLALARKIKTNEDITKIPGICYIAKEPVPGYVNLPSYDEVSKSKNKFSEMFHLFYQNNDPISAKGLLQKQDARYLVHNPPSGILSAKKLDEIYDMDFSREVHPYYKRQGQVNAQQTIKFSITTHRGCYGECNFCSISLHQGRRVISRSEQSILKEAQKISRLPDFKGYIQDVGGPTANMYAIECQKKFTSGACKHKRCLYPVKCDNLPVDHSRQIQLLKNLRRLCGIKKVFVASGIRYDMVLNDKISGIPYLEELVNFHISGQLKIAPEHTQSDILKLMGKPGIEHIRRFKSEFDRLNNKARMKQFLTYYLIAAHPGCRVRDMLSLKNFIKRYFKITPEQIQIFTPLPSTYSALMYYTCADPFTNKKIFVEKTPREKEKQKIILTK